MFAVFEVCTTSVNFNKQVPRFISYTVEKSVKKRDILNSGDNNHADWTFFTEHFFNNCRLNERHAASFFSSGWKALWI